jgi:alpha-amylase
MTAVVFYFQVHQPNRLNRFRFDDVGNGREYFDDGLNRLIVERVAERCYLPMNAVIAEAIADTGGRFRCSFAITGTLLTQLERWAPAALDSFVALSRTGAVEFVCETGYHSLASVGDHHEFTAQVEEQRKRLKELFGLAPTSFRNTELILDNAIAKRVEDMGFACQLGEGVDRLLEWRSPRRVYRAKGCKRLKLLLRDYLFSDDIAFRFSNRQWPEYPLMADRYAEWLHRAAPEDTFVGLFMDYETFGEHQNVDTGILDFMKHLPRHVLADERFEFRTPAEVAAANEPVAELDIPLTLSWADKERDLTAWLENDMQKEAHARLYALLPKAREAADAGHPEILATWRKLSTSDHVYYMSTKWHSDGDVHEYFTPYDSPHDSFILFMHVLDDLAVRIEAALAAPRAGGREETGQNPGQETRQRRPR